MFLEQLQQNFKYSMQIFIQPRWIAIQIGISITTITLTMMNKQMIVLQEMKYYFNAIFQYYLWSMPVLVSGSNHSKMIYHARARIVIVGPDTEPLALPNNSSKHPNI
jgi:hypothetical protein